MKRIARQNSSKISKNSGNSWDLFEEYWKISSPWVTWVYSVDPLLCAIVNIHTASLSRTTDGSLDAIIQNQSVKAGANSSKISAQFQHCQANYRPGQSKILPQNIDNSRANLARFGLTLLHTARVYGAPKYGLPVPGQHQGVVQYSLVSTLQTTQLQYSTMPVHFCYVPGQVYGSSVLPGLVPRPCPWPGTWSCAVEL